MNRKSQESFRKLGNVMSDCLARILKDFKLKFEQLLPTSVDGTYEKGLVEEETDQNASFGGDEPGGGGPGADNLDAGGIESEEGKSGPGEENYGGGEGRQRKGTGQGASTPQAGQSSGPRIEFQNHAGADRAIDLGSSLVVNTLHSDFMERNSSKTGKIRLDARLLNYVALIVAPPCVHRLFMRKGKVPTVLEAGGNIIDLSTQLEKELTATVAGIEIDQTI